MTTRSVRQYVTGIYRKLNLDETQVTKIITGGPDGDLGSNEIMMGKEKLIAIVDGSGVLYDPNGIDRDAIVECAKNRQMVKFFKGKISKDGYFVSVEDRNVKLPSGEVIQNGEQFRNSFVLRKDVECDMFVPCGGRPETINPYNWEKLFKENGQPRFKYIVEGANLFCSESVRPRLQGKGIILFKDASTNKGGVTSSSMEVLAALALDEDEHTKHVRVHDDGTVPEFYSE